MPSLPARRRLVSSRPTMNRLAQAELLSGLAAVVGERHVSASHPDRIAYSSDMWPKAQIWKLGGDIERYPPDCVCWPGSEDEVARVVAFLASHDVPIIPYGGGSGVAGGTVPLHGGVVVDVKRLNAVEGLDRESLIVTAQPGIIGQHLEDWLGIHGVTLGHFPSSIMCSTLGGWLATRSAGQASSRYGKIEDMVLSVRVVLADGRVLDTADRSLGAPDWTQLLVGSEGTLGVLTLARLRAHSAPDTRLLRGFRFRRLDHGLDGMRMAMQAGLRPMVLRLYDPFDSLVALGRDAAALDDSLGRSALGDAAKSLLLGRGRGEVAPPASRLAERLAPLARRARNVALAAGLSRPAALNRMAQALPSPCLLIVGFEGPEVAVKRDMWRARQLLAAARGEDAGPALGEQWYERRYDVSFRQSRLYEAGAFVDTMEVATTWDRLSALYAAVRRAIAPHAFVMAHLSHAYRDGCSIYFTFAAHRRDSVRAARLYDRIWVEALAAAHAVGATCSHHHGVGLAKAAAMADEHGEMVRVWRALKATLDPTGVMNPGKLFPGEEEQA